MFSPSFFDAATRRILDATSEEAEFDEVTRDSQLSSMIAANPAF